MVDFVRQKFDELRELQANSVKEQFKIPKVSVIVFIYNVEPNSFIKKYRKEFNFNFQLSPKQNKKENICKL